MQELLEQVARWAAARTEVRGVGLVGSHARGVATPGSDVDLLLLVTRPDELIGDPGWAGEFGRVRRSCVEDWGRVTSLRVWYESGLEVEFGLATPAWAEEPDEGTRRVVRAGMRVLFDPDGTLARLAAS